MAKTVLAVFHTTLPRLQCDCPRLKIHKTEGRPSRPLINRVYRIDGIGWNHTRAMQQQGQPCQLERRREDFLPSLWSSSWSTSWSPLLVSPPPPGLPSWSPLLVYLLVHLGSCPDSSAFNNNLFLPPPSHGFSVLHPFRDFHSWHTSEQCRECQTGMLSSRCPSVI